MIDQTHLSTGILMFGLMLTGSQLSAQVQCSPSLGAEQLAAQDNGYGTCITTPDALQIDLYKLALCTTKPSFTDDSSCVYLLNETSAVTVDVELGVQTNIGIDEISIPEGQYKYAIIMFDNEFGIKNTYEFSEEQAGANSSTGTTCWSNGNRIQWDNEDITTLPVTCGAEPNAKFSSEKLLAFGTGNGGASNVVTGRSTQTTIWDAYHLHDPSTLAEVEFDENGPLETDATSNFIWAVQEFKSIPEITAATRNVDLAFRVTDGVEIVGRQLQGSPNGHYITSMALASFAFLISTSN